MNIDEKIAGMWWFSDQDPKTAVSGDLFIQEKKLELNGSLDGLINKSFGGSKFVSIHNKKTILGISKTGKKYTLEFYNEPSFALSFPGYQADTYSLGTIFEGGHFPKTEKLSFSKYFVEFPYLFDWVNDGVITTEFFFKNENDKKDIYHLKIEKPKKIIIFQNSSFKLVCTTQVEKFPIPSKELNILQKTYFTIEAIKNEISISDFYSIVSHLGLFLSIAIGESITPINYRASVQGNTDIIEIYPNSRKQKEYAKIHQNNMNFLFSEIKSESQTIFDNWFAQKSKHEDIFNLFSSINDDSSKNLNNQFKDIISAIEGYVRIREGKTDIDLQKAIKTLNEQLPGSDRVFAKTDYDKIRVTRNKLTHIEIKNKEAKLILDNKEKWICFKKLHFLLEYSFLKDIGMSGELLNKFYKNNKGIL